MCKDLRENYPKLTKRAIEIEQADAEQGHAEGSKAKNAVARKRPKPNSRRYHAVPYWHIAGAESLNVVDADSVLAHEFLYRM